MIKINLLKTGLFLGLSMMVYTTVSAQPGGTTEGLANPNELIQKRAVAQKVTLTPRKPGIDPKNIGRDPGSYSITVKLNGFKNVNIYLADNFGDKQYLRDTCMLDDNGVGTFTGNPKLQRGMYMIVFPLQNGYYEIPITDDQEFYFEGDSTMDETKIIVRGSSENEAFADYQKARQKYGEARRDIDTRYGAETNPDIKKQIKAERDSLDKADIAFREKYMSTNPNHLLTKLFKAFQSVQIPKNPNPADSMYDYRYFKNHFWDNIDFSESGLIRAPSGLLINKLDDYIDKISFQDPDSLVQAVDIAIGKTIPYTETQKYFVQHLTNKFQDKKIMCLDNVTIHLIHKYYCNQDAWWYDDTAGRRKMCEEASRALPTMCGKRAPNLRLADTAGKYHELYQNMGRYTIVFFYDPTCGHCKQVIPVVNKVFLKHKKNGIRVYAVSSEGKYDEWRKMMREKPELSGWVNVCKTDLYYPWPYLRYDYNIQANPTIFILDETGKIIGKKIDEHQLEFFIESLLFEKGIIKVRPTPPSDKPATEGDPDAVGSETNQDTQKAKTDTQKGGSGKPAQKPKSSATNNTNGTANKKPAPKKG